MVPNILNALIREKDPYVQSSLILALGRLNVKDAIPTLETFLSDADARIRANAVEALGLIGDPSVFPKLISTLDDENNRVLANAVVALGNCPYIQLDAPVKRMYSSPEILMRRSLIYCLVELKKPRYFHYLEKLLSDKEEVVRSRAAEALKVLAVENIPEAVELVRKRGL